jgi:hypothetical protein
MPLVQTVQNRMVAELSPSERATLADLLTRCTLSSLVDTGYPHAVRATKREPAGTLRCSYLESLGVLDVNRLNGLG